MRPNQQNKRSRSRNNNRKSSNPLTRSYESNGPDVRVRGNAAHIAEKYMQLARDANSSGDSVAAENYLQHAEHYFRIISAAQDQANNQQNLRAEQMARTEQADKSGAQESANVEAGAVQDAPVIAGEAAGSAKEKDASAENGAPNVAPNAAPVEKKEPRAPKEARAPRVRRPRRPRVSEKPAVAPAPQEDEPKSPAPENATDPADAPQPDLGELPSFVTEHTKTSAAE
ncbi:FIG00689276: hypothetical protein [hydrothermal vent metagenome]|uniref:DUF4167 domain-containing protein n=1 Tax=hydrothermal vent metagenome TaxID=652676 RepID=A0A3B0TZP3_9ZZZZ